MSPRSRLGGAGLVTASLIALWIQLEGTRSMPYRDVSGVLTVCSGHTGPDVIPGVKWSKRECEEVTMKDLTKFALVVLRCVHAELSEHQFEALVVFAGNVGEGAFCESTLVERLNEGNHAAAQLQFSRWVYAGGKPVLMSRRAAELARFRLPDTPLAEVRIFDPRLVALGLR